MKETAVSVAFNEAAPADERADAHQQSTATAAAQLRAEYLAPHNLRPLIEFVERQAHEDPDDILFGKALARPNLVPFVSGMQRRRKDGMQSVFIDNMQISVQGYYFERPGAFTFDGMRQMVEQTPILNAVIMQRIRQIQRFCRPQRGGRGPGFRITARERDEHVDDSEKAEIRRLESFFMNCGWEKDPRQRLRKRRDDFPGFMSKLVRDTLTMDSMPIETEFKRARSLGLDGMYAVDGATIRLCTEEGYRGEDEIYALQVVQGNIRTPYTYQDLLYIPRNPRTDVAVGGYGLAETELLIRVVTGFLNAFTYNTRYFDSNALPKGILNLYGNYDEKDIQAFKRFWNSMVKGVNNAWALPVMVAKDGESKAQFEEFGSQASELMFGKWMTFLGSIICAIYGMAPDEINFESFTNGTSSLSGSDTEEKIASSKDKGLRPLLSYFENLFGDYIMPDLSDRYTFEWTGLDEEDAAQVWERKKMTRTVNEIRAEDGVPAADGKWGDAPLNPSLVGVWQQEAMPQQEDYGTPGADDGGDQPGGGGPDFGHGQEGGQQPDFGQPDPDGADAGAPGGDAPQAAGQQPDDGTEMAKAFGFPVLRLEA